jgi:hypothetical protein
MLTALCYGVCKLGAVEVLVVPEQQVCLVDIAETADEHRGLASVVLDLCLCKRVAYLVIRHKNLRNNIREKKLHYILYQIFVVKESTILKIFTFS